MEQNKCNKCGRPMNYATEPKCNYCDACMSEYCGCKLGRIKEMEPTCDSTAVIPSITVESVEGITNLANCLVHVNDINTTFYVDDKHRVMITWAGPVDIPGYDMENNPNGYRDQIVTDIEKGIAVIYDKHGKGYTFGIYDSLDSDGAVTQAINDKLDEMAANGTLADIIAQYIGEPIFGFDTVADMKASTTLQVGDRVKTLGFHTINDGGGALYKITDTGTANEMDVIAIGATLYANLMIDDFIRPEQVGAYGDGISNDTQVLNYLFENYLHIVLTKTYFINNALSVSSNSIIDGVSTGKIIREPLDGSTDNIFYLSGKENVAIKNLKLESSIEYASVTRPDHPNWNNSQSSNISGFFIERGCSNITIENIISKNLYNEVTLNSSSAYGLNNNITINGYRSTNTTSSAIYIGYSKNIIIKNVIVTAHDLPLGGVHFIYIGHNGGDNIKISDCEYYGNHYTRSGFNFAYADFTLGDTDPNSFNIICNNCYISCPGNIRFQNSEITCQCNDCEFVNLYQYQSGNYPTANWVGSITSAEVNKGRYEFNNCKFSTNATLGEYASTEALIMTSFGSASASLDTKFDFHDCHISNMRYVTQFNAVDSNVNLYNCVIDIRERIFQKIKYTGTYMLDDCIITQVSNYLISSTGTESAKFIMKDCFVNSTATGATFNSENSNGYIELYNNVIFTTRASDFIVGSAAANVLKHNTLINGSILS